MLEFVKKVENSKLADNVKYYWRYMYELGKLEIVPYLLEQKAFKVGDKVAEIGSAEGGVLAAFVEAGATEGLGTDIAQGRLEFGEQIAKICDVKIEFLYHNILTQEINEEWKEKYDLVLLRDVIEHLDDTELALKNIKKIIKKGGKLFVTFPPYYSPYGGHQHTLANFWGKLPYIHCLPLAIFKFMIKSGRAADILEVKRLINIKLTTAKFDKAFKSAGFKLSNVDYYLIRPVFRMKFGLTPVKITKLASLPLVKNIFTLEAAYLLQAD